MWQSQVRQVNFFWCKTYGYPHCNEAMLWRQDDPFVEGACFKMVGSPMRKFSSTVRLFLVIGKGRSESIKNLSEKARVPVCNIVFSFRQQNGIHQHSAGPMCTRNLHSGHWGYIWRWKYKFTGSWSRWFRRDANRFSNYESTGYSICNKTTETKRKEVSFK